MGETRSISSDTAAHSQAMVSSSSRSILRPMAAANDTSSPMVSARAITPADTGSSPKEGRRNG
jgi:thymidine phosphorylase